MYRQRAPHCRTRPQNGQDKTQRSIMKHLPRQGTKCFRRCSGNWVKILLKSHLEIKCHQINPAGNINIILWIIFCFYFVNHFLLFRFVHKREFWNSGFKILLIIYIDFAIDLGISNDEIDFYTNLMVIEMLINYIVFKTVFRDNYIIFLIISVKHVI